MAPLTPSAQRIRDLADCLVNHDDPGQERAVAALDADRAAFWHTGAVSGRFPLWRNYVNDAGGIRAGLDQYRAEFGKTPDDAQVLRFLDLLIPLNDDAIIDLAMAYEKLGTFRDMDELEARERDAIMSPRWPVGAQDNSTSAQFYASVFHEAQQRFLARQPKPVRKPEPRPVFTPGGVEKMLGDMNRVAADALFADPATNRALERADG